MPTALIAEDEPLLAQALAADLARLWPGLQLLATVGDGLSASAQALALRPQVCFFDIRMPGATGLEAAQTLAEDWPAGVPFPLLVFVTAYDQYALAAFEAQAVDYLVKPVDATRLAACVARLQKRLADAAAPAAPGDAPLAQALDQLRALLGSGIGVAPAPAPARLEVIQAGVGNTVHLVPVAEVLYFEAADKYLRVVTAEREHLIRLSLRELLPQLDAQQFWQVHRSLVVRAAAITTATRDESGKVFLQLRGRAERLTASRLYAHLFKGM
ncbi:LytR/AlgR family response regulator transcription factor [Pseudaquabacterium pictum]|uniref:DNA-binding response regulator n=1 Tax=Pseudaquabacterium pictum TaxID=2315236 RepID=A0A480AMG5_9BURK|nr:LytTR family DNA-binding domain-containing protein [Rubrivivax pictus]GCL61940.1 DNA-binding response regulator [Rubrivivax pictus]